MMFSCDNSVVVILQEKWQRMNAVVFDITVGNFYSVSVEPTDH